MPFPDNFVISPDVATALDRTSRAYLFFKRLFDIIFSLFFLILLSPVLLVVSIAICVDSKGAPFFAQQRVGKNAESFTMYKFRSMCKNAEEMKAYLAKHNQARGPVFKIADDPRITRVGKFIRRTSIDELPQLLNILKGDMSLVGPRPPLVQEVEQYETAHYQRLLVKPGLTCIWQISGRSTINFDKWMELDLTYIKRRGFFFDLSLILKTIPAVLKGEGAY